jgi:hypothetical protein
MAKSGSKKSYCGLTFRKLENMSTEERMRYQILIIQIDLTGKDKWCKKVVWYDAHPRRSENLWNYDKLGRPFSVGQVIVWYSSSDKYGLTEHFAFISSYFADTEAFYAYPIKSEKYIGSWEKKLTKINDAFITNTRLEVSRLRQEYGALIVGNLYDPKLSNSDFPPPHI